MNHTFIRQEEDDKQTKFNGFPTNGMQMKHCYVPNHNFNISRNNFTHKINTLQKQQQHNLYHTTTKKEILPLIAVGSIAVIGVYSFKALKRMDEDWEDYEEALREYKLEHGLSDEDMENIIDAAKNTEKDDNSRSTGNASASSSFEQGKLAIDLGSINIRVAHYNDKNAATKTKPTLMVNREGSRSTPNSIIVETDGSIVSGKMAAAKIYERSKSNNPVLNPYQLLSNNNSNDARSPETIMTTKYAVQNVISSLAKDALEQAVGRNGTNNNTALFSIDSNNGYNAQPIFTYPPPKTEDVATNHKDGSFLEQYQIAINDIMSPSSIAKFIPEPICAVKGARYHNLIPSVSSGASLVMVVDVGGETTSISIIDESQMNNNNDDNDKIIQYHTRVTGFGGETIVESIMNHLSKSFYGSTIDKVSDTMGVQRLYDSSQSAAMEIGGSKYGRIQINIPYLSVDEKMQPKHLDLGLSANVIKGELNDLVQKKIIPNVASDQAGVLSNVMHQPNDLQSLFSSMIMNAFEKSGHNPFTLNSVLIIGGGARSPFIKDAIKSAFGQLAGDQFVQDKVVIPTDALVEEMVILGAALSSDD